MRRYQDNIIIRKDRIFLLRIIVLESLVEKGSRNSA